MSIIIIKGDMEEISGEVFEKITTLAQEMEDAGVKCIITKFFVTGYRGREVFIDKDNYTLHDCVFNCAPNTTANTIKKSK